MPTNTNILALAFGFLVGACTTPANPAKPLETGPAPLAPSVLAEQASDVTVALVEPLADGSAGVYCAGVWLSERLIVTAHHCLSGPVGSYLTYSMRGDLMAPTGEDEPSPTYREAQVFVEDEEHDLALIVATGQTYPHGVARLAWSTPAVGAKVSTVGHPIGLWWSYSSGDIAAIRYMDADPMAFYVQATTPISKGNSGGGLFDEHGSLIGIAHAIAPKGANIGFFVHLDHVANLARPWLVSSRNHH